MPGKWDTNLKLLLNAKPEHFVQWFFPEAISQGKIERKSNNLETHELEVDGLLPFVLYGIACLLHIEFQSYYDENMARRMWEYNAIASIMYGRPTYSVLIYLKECRVTEPYYEEKMPTGEINHPFHFRVIKLWEMHPEDIKSLGLVGLLPLMVLTEGGNTLEMVDEIIADLAPVEKETRDELLSALFVLSFLAIPEEAQVRWLKRRFFDMKDALKESWAYQFILQEGREEGLQEGREEERRQEVQRLRQMLTSFVELHFPTVVSDARKHVETIQDPDVLQQVTLKIFAAQSEEQTLEILREAA